MTQEQQHTTEHDPGAKGPIPINGRGVSMMRDACSRQWTPPTNINLIYADIEELGVRPDEDTTRRIGRAFDTSGQKDKQQFVLDRYLRGGSISISMVNVFGCGGTAHWLSNPYLNCHS